MQSKQHLTRLGQLVASMPIILIFLVILDTIVFCVGAMYFLYQLIMYGM